MTRRNLVTHALVTLLSDQGYERIPARSPRLAARYRPLIIGPAILWRPLSSHGHWHVAVSTDGLLRPRAPRSAPALRRLLERLRGGGNTARLAAALVTPQDVLAASASVLDDVPAAWGRPGIERPAGRRHSFKADMYGWSLLYQLPGMVGVARIDAGERISDLPAAYESPQELLDRTDFLAARGIATRPLALVTQPEDFARPAGAAYARNRFVPHAVYQRTCDPADFC